MKKTIALSQGRSLVAGYSLAPRPSKRWLVYLPESGAGFHSGSRTELTGMIGKPLAGQYNYLAINKTGIGPHSTDATAFERSFRRRLRIQDALTAMQTLIPHGHSIDLMGYSEGAYLAPQIARLDKRVRSLVMIGGGTRGWLNEELSNAGQSQKGALLKQIREIESRPRSTQKWNGFSYATWNSYRQDSTYNALRALNIPALAVLGARDRTIDFKSALTDLRTLGRHKPIYTRVLSSCGHSFAGHWDIAYAEVYDFLENLNHAP
ncbi:MAG: alpha/beta hydrolase [Bdellovibrionales bacterium]|nr:alpha/beta hydrolase [Bdellovibrionales bacterium]